MSTATVRDLLSDEILRDARLIGGAAGLDAWVHDVVLVASGPELDAVRPGAAAVLDLRAAGGPTRRQHLVDMVARRLHARSGRLLVAAGALPSAALSTARLADRLGLPVVVTGGGDGTAPAIVARLMAVVGRPELGFVAEIARAARRLHAAAGRIDRLLAVVDDALRARTAVLAPDGTVVAGTAPRDPLSAGGPAVADAEQRGDIVVARCPVQGPGGEASLWLVAEADAERSGPLWREAGLQILRMAAAYVSAWFAGERLAAERDARQRSALLAELLQLDGPVPPYLGEHAARLGWRLDGWHTGIHIALIDSRASPHGAAPATAVTAALAGELAASGISGPLGELAGGWSTWATLEHEPAKADERRLAAAVTGALAAYHRGTGRPAVVAGLGRPAAGRGGIATTLAEARQAAVVAASAGEAGAVAGVDELGAKRLLLGWYGSAAVRDHVERLLQPLLADAPLLKTVEVYLDRRCSAAETAERLGLHRNTVTQRIRRAERILGASFRDADDRLAIHLACRALRVGGHGD